MNLRSDRHSTRATRHPGRLVPPVLIAILPSILAAGCEPYRVEYRNRPAYYERMVDDPLPTRVEREDGTVMLFNQSKDEEKTKTPVRDGTKDFKVREQQEDGTMALQAFLPAHVVENVLWCLRYQEYGILWEQVLSEQTREEYAARGEGEEELTAYFKEHRLELAKMLNRMRMGFGTHETVVENRGDVMICKFWPRTADLFRFKRVVIAREGFNLKLLLIK